MCDDVIRTPNGPESMCTEVLNKCQIAGYLDVTVVASKDRHGMDTTGH